LYHPGDARSPTCCADAIDGKNYHRAAENDILYGVIEP